MITPSFNRLPLRKANKSLGQGDSAPGADYHEYPGADTARSYFMGAFMSKYVLGSRSRVVNHVPAREHIAITLAAGGLVLFRATMLLVSLVLAWHYGLLP